MITLAATQGRDNNFNFLRFTFAVLVLLSHSPELVDGNRSREILTRILGSISFGELAVNEFFLLSGYMIVKSWVSKPNFINYIQKRVARIYPGYLMASLLSIFVFGLFGASNYYKYLHDINYLKISYFVLILMGPPTPDTFHGTAYPVVDAPMWTLSYEFRCYILVAIIGLCVITIDAQRKVWLSIFLCVALLSFLTSFFDVNQYHFPGSFYIFGSAAEIIRMLSCFSAGACFYLFREEIRYTSPRAALAFFILILCLVYYPKIATASICFFGGYCTFYFAFCKIRFLKVFQSSPDISYGIYLYGWPIQKLILWYFPLTSPWVLFIFAWAMSSVFGLLSWNLIELPALRFISNLKIITNDSSSRVRI